MAAIPGLVVPHGRPEEVREFLRALPAPLSQEYFIQAATT